MLSTVREIICAKLLQKSQKKIFLNIRNVPVVVIAFVITIHISEFLERRSPVIEIAEVLIAGAAAAAANRAQTASFARRPLVVEVVHGVIVRRQIGVCVTQSVVDQVVDVGIIAGRSPRTLTGNRRRYNVHHSCQMLHCIQQCVEFRGLLSVALFVAELK